MNRKLYPPIVLLLAVSMSLGACGGVPALEEAPPTIITPAIETLVTTETPVSLNYLPLMVELWASIPANTGYGLVSAAKLGREISDEGTPFLLDVRAAEEMREDGHIAGAVNIPIRNLLQNLDKLPAPDQAIVVYCNSGHRSGFALAALKMLGYVNVRNLGGGFAAWKAAGLPISTHTVTEPAVLMDKPQIKDKTLLVALDDFLSSLPDGEFSVDADVLAVELAHRAAYVLDVRSQGERDRDGHIEDDALIPFSDLLKRLNQLPADRDARIVVYCVSGHRGALVAMTLRLLGYTNVFNLAGGLNGWREDGKYVADWVDWAAELGDFVQNLPADEGYYGITAEKFNSARAEQLIFVIDVREPSEVQSSGHIKGAVNIPIRVLLKHLDKLPAREQMMVIYCDSDHRSALAMTVLRALGYTEVYSLADGSEGWEEAGFTLEFGLPPEARVVTPTPEVDTIRLKLLDAYLAALPDGFNIVGADELNHALAGEPAPVILDVCIAEGATTQSETAFVAFHTSSLRQLQVPDDKETQIVVVCEHGHRSAIFKMYLNFLGYVNVRALEN
jgi:rhodanese-related sulfurtransferase